MTISAVGSLVDSKVTSSQSTVSLTTVNIGDCAVAAFTTLANITVTGVSSSHATWTNIASMAYNATIGASMSLWVGTVTSATTANVTLTFSSAIGATTVQRTIKQLTAGLGSACEWFTLGGSQTNGSSTTMTYPSLTASTAAVGYNPSTTPPFAYVGYAVPTVTGSAGATSGFSYTVDTTTDVLAVNTAVASGTTPAPTATQSSSSPSLAAGVILMPATVGAPILQGVVSNLRATLEVAWGADLTNLTGSTWVWADITPNVQLSQGWGIDLQIGAPDEATQTQPSQLTAVLDNTAGLYSLGPQSSNYPNVTRNVPVRLRISTNSGSTWTVRYQGNAVAWKPNWDTSGQWATVTLTASGWLRQLNQGTPFPQSSMYVGTMADSSVKAYWPLEDNQNSTSARAAIGGSDGIFRNYNARANTWSTGAGYNPGTFASYTNVASSAPILAMGSGGGLELSTSTIGTTSVTVSMIIGNLVGQSGANGCLFSVYTPNGAAVKRWDIFNGCDTSSGGSIKGAMSIYGVSSAVAGIPYGATVFGVANITFDNLPNTDYEIGLSLSQSGATTTYDLMVYEIGTNNSALHYSGTVGSNSNGAQVNDIIIGTFAAANVAIGHVTIRNTITTVGSDATWINAHKDEVGTTRLTRLANASNVPITINTAADTETSTNTADTMGFQFYDSLANLLREVETTGQGRLYDGLNIGLTYVTRLLRESQQPALTLDVSSGVVVMPFSPIYDDQAIVNQVAVSQRDGSTYIFDDTTSENAIGVFSTSATVNQYLPTVSQLGYTAKWLGRASSLVSTAYRYPTWSFALEKSTGLISSWLACFPSCRIDVTNISSARSQHPSGTIRNVLEGWHETISQHQWHVTANTSSYEPWKVITLADATGTTADTLGRYESDGSTVVSNVAAGGTSISVATPSGPIWTQSSVTADDFPLTVAINGNPVTVSAISGAASPQTFTVSALAHAVNAGDAVTIYQNAVLGM